MRKNLLVLTAALGAATLGSAAPAAAQNFLLPGGPDRGIMIEAMHSDFKGFDASALSSVWYLSGRLPITSMIKGVVDVPFSYAKGTFSEAGEQSNSVLGNPYLGVEITPSQRLMLEVGVRAPLNTADAESFADVIAFIANPLRPEAFLDNLVPLSAAATFNYPFAKALSLRAQAGVTTLLYTGDDEDESTETGVDYGVVGTWAPGIARVALGVTGRWYASADEGNFAEQSLHHAGISADVNVFGFRPGVSVRLPIDKDYREVVGPSIGMYVQVPLR